MLSGAIALIAWDTPLISLMSDHPLHLFSEKLRTLRYQHLSRILLSTYSLHIC